MPGLGAWTTNHRPTCLFINTSKVEAMNEHNLMEPSG
jgi:hypothetical protein